jgi:CubicO group peptidase (beta-lactamase class C family)
VKLKAFLAGYELPRDPGASYEYSNLGFGLLGYALAQSRHTSWDALTDEEILKSLSMTSSGTGVDGRHARPSRSRSRRQRDGGEQL